MPVPPQRTTGQIIVDILDCAINSITSRAHKDEQENLLKTVNFLSRMQIYNCLKFLCCGKIRKIQSKFTCILFTKKEELWTSF